MSWKVDKLNYEPYSYWLPENLKRFLEKLSDLDLDPQIQVSKGRRTRVRDIKTKIQMSLQDGEIFSIDVVGNLVIDFRVGANNKAAMKGALLKGLLPEFGLGTANPQVLDWLNGRMDKLAITSAK